MAESLFFAERIKELRQNLNLSQRDFAESIGVSAMSISTYESNAKSPSIETVIKIANRHNVSIDWLCGLSDKKAFLNKIETYSDLIRIIIQLEETSGVELALQTESRSSDAKLKCVFEIPELTDFYTEWLEMKVVRDTEPMGAKLYQLWLKDVLEKGENRWIP